MPSSAPRLITIPRQPPDLPIFCRLDDLVLEYHLRRQLGAHGMSFRLLAASAETLRPTTVGAQGPRPSGYTAAPPATHGPCCAPAARLPGTARTETLIAEEPWGGG